jgi:hypothetical protein
MTPLTQNYARCRLIEQLMMLGWYHLGQGPRDDRGQLTWGFREGHVLDISRENWLWIAADDELSAMRTLVKRLEAEAEARQIRHVVVSQQAVSIRQATTDRQSSMGRAVARGHASSGSGSHRSSRP